MTRLDLDFSKYSINQIIEKHRGHLELEWQNDVLNFLENYYKNDSFDCFTSGSTGIPKKNTFSKAQMQYSANSTLKYFNLQKGDSVFLSLSVNFIAGKMMLVRAIEGKLKLTVVRASSNPLQYIQKDEHFKFTPLVPMQLFELLKSKSDIRSLGKLLIGGGEVSQNLIDLLKDQKIEVWSSFGMTETITHFALKKISPIQDEFYKCLPDYFLSEDENNCLIISNPFLLNKPFESKDVVSLNSPINFNFIGRLDNMINSGGVKIFPEVVEQKLKGIIPVEFIITSISDEKLGQKVVLVYEGNSFDFTTVVQQKIKLRLSAFEYPKTYVSIDFFPRTASGKVVRNAIKI